MKYLNIKHLGIALALSLFFVSCSSDDKYHFSVDKPEDVEILELLNKYDALKSYIDRAENENFKLGAATFLGGYINKGVNYRMINSNFDEITLGYEMKHGAVVDSDGELQLTEVNELLGVAEQAGISVFGHTLCWHANQNASYLNNLLLTGVEFDPNDNRNNYIPNGDFEKGDDGWNSWFWGGESSRSVVDNGLVGDKCLRFYHEADEPTAPWAAQIALDFDAVPAGDYTFSFFVRSDAPGRFRCSSVGDVHYQADVETKPGWQYIEWNISSTGQLTGIRFDMGYKSGTYYLDEVRLNVYSDEYEKPIILEYTEEEQAEIISTALEDWISQMVENCKTHVKAWDVVNEPMSDWPNPYKLKSGDDKEELDDDEFYWQDYLGKDYGVIAFKLARKYGNTDDIHFINDYNLEWSLDKCKGLIEYVEYIESQGAKVDGIGTQMHIGISSDKSNIEEMFKLLGATGKLIKISELDVKVESKEPTKLQLEAQADMYQYVVDMYMKHVPAAQRYGITVWSILDSDANSIWLPDEQQGLWTTSYRRKPAYGGFANGLAGKDLQEEF